MKLMPKLFFLALELQGNEIGLKRKLRATRAKIFQRHHCLVDNTFIN